MLNISLSSEWNKLLVMSLNWLLKHISCNSKVYSHMLSKTLLSLCFCLSSTSLNRFYSICYWRYYSDGFGGTHPSRAPPPYRPKFLQYHRVFQQILLKYWVGTTSTSRGGSGAWAPDPHIWRPKFIHFGGPVYNSRAKQLILGPFLYFFSKKFSSLASLGITFTFCIPLVSLCTSFHISSSYVHTSTLYWLKP